MNTLYTIFGVKEDASEKEIRNAFLKLAHKCHPDKGGSAKDFQIISDAKGVLLDPVRRANYDRQLAQERGVRMPQPQGVYGFNINVSFGGGMGARYNPQTGATEIFFK